MNHVTNLAPHLLATIIARQCGQKDDARRHRFLAQTLGAPGLQGRLLDAAPAFQHNSCGDDLAGNGIGQRKRASFLNIGMLLEEQFDFLGRNLNSAAVDLVLAPAQDTQPALTIDLADVPGAEPTSVKCRCPC